jgi:hypothetical protein
MLSDQDAGSVAEDEDDDVSDFVEKPGRGNDGDEDGDEDGDDDDDGGEGSFRVEDEEDDDDPLEFEEEDDEEEDFSGGESDYDEE